MLALFLPPFCEHKLMHIDYTIHLIQIQTPINMPHKQAIHSRKRKTPPSDSAPLQFVDRVITVVTWTTRDNIVFHQPDVKVFYSEADFRAHACQVLFGGTMEQCKAMSHSYHCQLEGAFKVDNTGSESQLIQELRNIHGPWRCFSDLEEQWFEWFQQQPHCKMATASTAISWKECGIPDSMDFMKEMTDSSTSLSDIIGYLERITDYAIEVLVSKPPKGLGRQME